MPVCDPIQRLVAAQVRLFFLKLEERIFSMLNSLLYLPRLGLRWSTCLLLLLPLICRCAFTRAMSFANLKYGSHMCKVISAPVSSPQLLPPSPAPAPPPHHHLQRLLCEVLLQSSQRHRLPLSTLFLPVWRVTSKGALSVHLFASGHGPVK